MPLCDHIKLECHSVTAGERRLSGISPEAVATSLPTQRGSSCGLIDLMLVVDSSGSIRNMNPEDGSVDNWQLIRDFLSSLTQLFNIGTVSSHQSTSTRFVRNSQHQHNKVITVNTNKIWSNSQH